MSDPTRAPVLALDDLVADLPDVLAWSGGVAWGPTAALLHGIDLVDDPVTHHVAVPRADRRAPDRRVRWHRVDLPRADLTRRHGLPVTDLPRTVLDCLRYLPLPEAVALGDSAVRGRPARLADLRARVAALPGAPGLLRVRESARLLTASSESVLESLARVVLVQAGLAPDALQLPVTDPDGHLVARVDMAWPAARLVVELDGFAYHSDRQAVRRDRARANRLALLGWCVLRFGWEDVVGHPERVAAAVRAALAAA